jgi:cyclophilin family peptidyl-prolyl cis-trans isomerase
MPTKDKRIMPSLPSLPSRLRLPVAFCVALLVGCQASAAANPKVPAGSKSSGGLHATMVTDKGTIEFELDAADSPMAVENFRLLAEHGYYDGTKFHRIVSGFMIQGGDPNGNGTGGESAWGGKFADEIKPDSDLYRRGYRRGVLAMANSGPNTNGSQFFIMHKNYGLPPNYVIFGKVTKGIEVVDAIAASPVAMGVFGEISTPVSPQVVRKVTISP